MGTVELTGLKREDFIPEIKDTDDGIMIMHKDYYNHGRRNLIFLTNDQLATIYEKMRATAIKKGGGVRAELLSIIEKNIGKFVHIYEDAPWIMCKQVVSEIETCKEGMLSVYNELEHITNSDKADVSILAETETEITVLIEYKN